jgi:hypothetical protein
MARIPVLIVHDETGRIVSIARPSKGVKVVVGSGPGQSVFETEVEEKSIVELAGGSHRVDIEQKSVVAYTGPSSP